jgi:hypothetical protein
MGGLSLQILAVLGAIAAVVGLLVISRLKAAAVVFAGMLLFSAIGLPVDWLGNPIASWIMPLQIRRSEIYAACGAMMLVAMVFHLPRVRANRVSGQGVMMLVIGMYAGIAQILGAGDAVGGLQTMAFALLTIMPLVLILPGMYDSADEFMFLLRFVALAVMAWLGICAVQMGIRPWVLYPGGSGRFQGMLSNPQHAASFLAVTTAVCTFLSINDRLLRFRPLWVAAAAASAVCLLWTGSRTGLGMAGIGVAAILYARVGRTILFLPIAAMLFAVAFDYITNTLGASLGVRAFTERGDTRTVAWVGLWEQFLESPIFGTGSRLETRFSENSYLYGLATYGIGMGLLLVALLFLSVVLCLKVLVAKRWLAPAEKRLADLFIGFNAMYFAGSLFEGYVVSRVSTSLVFMMLFCGMGRWLLAAADERKHEADWAEPAAQSADLTESAALAAEAGYDEYGDYSDYGTDTSPRPA